MLDGQDKPPKMTKITIEAVGAVIGIQREERETPYRATLNVTGCEDVTQNGVFALIAGLRYVKMSTRFLGFVPKDDMDEQRALDARRDLELRSWRCIRDAWIGRILMREAKALLHRKRADRACRMVYRCYVAYKRHKAHEAVRQKKLREEASVFLQARIRA